jgi:hypothetical protein
MLKHPGFVGTFDSFVAHFFIAPGGISGTDERPTIVDSWDTLGVEVRLRGRNAFSGPELVSTISIPRIIKFISIGSGISPLEIM